MFGPERGFDAEFVNALYQATEIMGKYLAEGFVDLSRARLAAESVAKLGLDHVKGCFNVAPFVGTPHE